MQQRWKLTIEYRGTDYSGWQRQEEGIVSVQGAVEEAIFAFCQQRLTIHVAGRTDAGVHARAQVAHFDLDYGVRPLTGMDLVNALNAHLKPQPIVIVAAEPVGDDFHARFSAVNKLYLYRIINRPAPAALEDGLAWHIRRLLNVEAMREGATYLIGKHDFTTFRASDCQALSPVKTLDRLDLEVVPYDTKDGREIRIYAEGRSFLHHQVRNMVGALEMVGSGKWQPEMIKIALEARNRSKGGPTGPAEGLYLIRVDYPVEL
jgi:tRNA pseudouridine38-40 synthase